MVEINGKLTTYSLDVGQISYYIALVGFDRVIRQPADGQHLKELVHVFLHWKALLIFWCGWKITTSVEGGSADKNKYCYQRGNVLLSW